MIKSTEDFGKYIEKLVETSPKKARDRLLLGYNLFGKKLKYFPNKNLPQSKRKAAVYVNNVVQRALKNPYEVVLVNIFMPCEILEAMDVVPMCAELFSSFLNGSYCENIFLEEAEREGISETYCSFHKALLGASYLNLIETPKAIINTSYICDANNLTFKELSSHFEVPNYYLEVPNEQSEDSVLYVADQLREVVKFLEDLTGKKLDEEKLKKTVKRSQDTIDIFKKILVEKENKYLPSDVTSEMYETYFVHNGLGTEMCYDYAKTLLDDFKDADDFDGIKILWLHIVPSWQKPVRELFNFNDKVQIIACDMNFEDFVDLDYNKPYESMAKRLIYSNWNTGELRVKSALEMAKKLNVDGAICFCQWGCKQTMGLSQLFKDSFENDDIPVLVLDGDCVDRRNSSDGQVSTRLNAFIEVLEKKKYGK